MIISEEEATKLKSWVVKKLEDMYVLTNFLPDQRLSTFQRTAPSINLTDYVVSISSDADSDVLADYVLALVRADTPEPELRLNVIENLEDFLRPSEFIQCALDGLLSSNKRLI